MHDFEEGMLPFELPFTLGHENAGWVEALGDGVAGFDIGQPVAVYGSWGCGYCRPCMAGVEQFCDHKDELGPQGAGLGFDGGMASLMLVHHARHLVPLDSLSPVEAAPLTDAALTPYHAVQRALPLLVPGSNALVLGVGGLGHLAIQILEVLTPATVIAVDRSPEALALASEVGATYCVTPGPNAADEITTLTKGRNVDVVLDFVGAQDTLELGIAVIRPMGQLALIGVGDGSVPFNFFSQPFEASLATTDWGSRSELVEVLALAESGKITTKIPEFPLADAAGVYERIAAGDLRGRAVIVPNA
jgi:propanol-preferring alcohol dehydrogenase